MPIEAQQIAKSNMDRWLLDPKSYEIVPERGIVRLLKYRKSFDDEVLVMQDGAPLLLKGVGRALRASEVLPERADLALDMDGKLLSQGEFAVRYQEWLGAFSYPEGHEIILDPVPEVSAYVSEEPDAYGESSGYIRIGYPDPADQDKPEIKAQYDTEGRTQEEREADQQSDMQRTMIQALVDKLTPEQAAEMLEANSSGDGAEIPIVGETKTEEVEVSVPMFAAPCGQMCKSNAGVSAHVRHCKNDLCTGLATFTDGGEAE